ncbi:TlpA family protein disulfide reductase [Salicibibacter halophilus]|uniref:TlpA family protein disulfide reductase n=1 Tax=Salicibibacter halophilus TaxID=2502791 RepID=A0A514LGA4_9BACI|nr:TlpA disulfide reductase family protein [Salicibibacter halophilus]QDI90887.1 TlpA family protein disulfide reductase [Salicibibacter halophilus]
MRKCMIAMFLLVAGLMVSVFEEANAEEREDAVPVMQAVPFDGEDVDGNPVTLQDYEGTNMLLIFFTTWCEVCQQELPMLSDNYEALQEKGIEVLAVNMAASERKETDIEAFAKGLQMPVVVDRDGRIAKSYGVQGIPTTYAIDEQQQIIKPFYGPLNREQVLQAFE